MRYICRYGGSQLPARFWSKIVLDPPKDRTGFHPSLYESYCWCWTGAKSQSRSGRYGSFWHDGRSVRAHIYVVQALGNKIRKGYEVDHKCRNTLCVNPWHLEIVTGPTNRKRFLDFKRSQILRKLTI